MKKTASITLLMIVLCAGISAQEKPWYEKTKLGVLSFGDYYYLAQSHDGTIEGENGLWIRRIYLTLDHKIDDRLTARLRFEAGHPGDFTSSDRLEPFVKDAWLRYSINDRHDLIAGISPTPSFSLIEDYWGYRPLEKTPNDLFRINSSRDFGIAARGSLNASESLSYHVMFGNGSGVANESNEGKYAGGAVTFAPRDSLFFQVYADHDARPDSTDRSMLQAFAGWSGSSWRVGAQYLTQQRDDPSGDTDVSLASVFGVWEISDTLTLIGRFDHSFDPIPDASRIAYVPVASGADVSFLLIGADLKLHPNLGVIPNIEYLSYDGVGATDPDDELLPRLTFYVKF